jgi:peroxiredoxin
MKLFAKLCMAALLFVSMPAMAAVETGATAPAFKLKSASGADVDLADYAGKIVVLEWTNHQCPYVVKHYETGNMQGLQKEMTEQDVVWLSIVSSAPGRQGYTEAEEANMVIEKTGAAATARLFDPTGEVGKAYGAQTTPHMFVIDAEGHVAYQGAIDDRPTARHDSVDGAKNYVREAVHALQHGEAVATPSTKPYGCGVKYAI